MASRKTNSSNSSDDDGDFGPVLPSTQLQAQPTQDTSAVAASDGIAAPPLKRERLDEQAALFAVPVPLPRQGALLTATEKPPIIEGPTAAGEVTSAAAAAVSDEAAQKEVWDRYTRQHVPRAALYERSFQHTTLQDTYNALAAQTDTSATVPASTVHDLCVLHDALGALITTIDAAGIVRVWRKLPHGVFFITELDKVFSSSRKAGLQDATRSGNEAPEGEDEAKGVPRYHRTYWANAYAALQLLVFVRVEEELVSMSDVMIQEDDGAAVVAPAPRLLRPTRTVRVELRQVNPITFTVEARHAFSFEVPVLPVTTAEAAEASVDQGHTKHHQQALRAAPLQKSSTPFFALAYTRRPAFLTHQYAPHIAFFVSLPVTASSNIGNSSSGAVGGHGVVVCPCFPSLQARQRLATGSGSSSEGPVYTATRVSVANLIVQCVQQTSGLERAGTTPCVVIDAAGVVDYCTIETVADTGAPSAASPSGLTLKVIAGLAAVPAASREARLWRQWIRFDRRQRTGFYSLLRDAQQALKQQQQQHHDDHHHSTGTVAASTPADVLLLPCAANLTPDGKYVVVWSVRLLRTAAMPTRHSRIPSTQHTYRVTAASCLHVLEFATGACVGRYSEVMDADNGGAETFVSSAEDACVPTAMWPDYVLLRGRALAMQMQVEECVAASTTRYYVMVPEVTCAQLLRGSARAPDDEVAAVVAGRQVHVYELTFADRVSAPSSGAVAAATVRRLPRGPGELEPLVRQSDSTAFWKSGGHTGSADAEAAPLQLHLTSSADAARRLLARGSGDGDHHPYSCHTSLAAPVLCRAPLLLLRRAVTPLQDLKNLIAASPLGTALGPEGRKQLFLSSPTASDAAAESLLLTSSFEAGTTSLLVYSCELPSTGLVMQRFLARASQIATVAHGVVADGADEEKKQEQQQQQQSLSQQERRQLWTKLCAELHHERDYACGALLMTTVAPPPSGAVTSGEPPTSAMLTATSATESGNDRDEGVEQDVTAKSAGEADTSLLPAKPRTTKSVKVVEPDSPEAYVRALLSDVLPQLSAATTQLPVALVHVRGYGSIRVHLLPHIAPLASDNFIRLARRHYYDRLTFHRVIPNVIVQGGCPRGDGTGGASAFENGAPFNDEALNLFPFFSHTTEQQCCWLCMANVGPNTNGSQFFFTVPGGEAMPWLNGHHTVFGFAVDGLDVVRAISLAARDEEDKPLSPIIMERVDILSC